MMKAGRRAALTVALFVPILGFAGCVSAPSGLSAMGTEAHESVTLGDATAAVYLSEQWRDFEQGHAAGYVALIGEAGPVRLVRTAGMDNGQLLWDARGLAFADVDFDYLLADTLHSVASPKVGQQQALFAGPDGTRLGLYNDGFTDTGYVEQVVVTDATGAISRDVEGYYQVTGNCDGTLFGIAEPLGAYADAAEKLGPTLQDTPRGYPTLMLAQLSGTPDGAERVIDMSAAVPSSQDAHDTPCRAGTMFYLATAYDATGNSAAVLRSWDPASGARSERALVTAEGEAIAVHPDYNYFHGPTARSLRGDQFDWLGLDGVVWSTNLDTGITEELFTVDTYGIAPGSYTPSLTFTERTLTLLTWDPAAETTRLAEYDRLTGSLLRERSLPELHQLMADGAQIMRGLAVKPEDR